MENREDLKSILPFLPLKLESSTLVWPNQVIEALKSLSNGPSHNRVDSGEVLFLAITDLRNSLSLSSHHLASSTGDGFSLFFDEFLSRAEAAKWFGEVVPVMANLLLRLPTSLESYYQYADLVLVGVDTGLRLLEPQQPGIVFLTQELIAALLSCSFFCLFPIANRGGKRLPVINFDHLFASLYESYSEMQENKIKCIIHYFERICSCIPSGNVSFERKVLPLEHISPLITYPMADLWANSVISLCQFQVSSSGLIEDQSGEALEVDFANKYLGGGALHRGCVQEEIRFMINPELIAGMLFLPSMSDNEAIEIVGVERFSNYTGYAATFRYSGDYVDGKDVDTMGRRKTRIVAIDALSFPGSRQYRLDCLLREVNKAFCGFVDQPKYKQYLMLLQSTEFCGFHSGTDDVDAIISETEATENEDCVLSQEAVEAREDLIKATQGSDVKLPEHYTDVGVVTGNWGCGAFGGDPEVKAMLQWLAASQVCQWILLHKWSVGDLWNMLVDYSSRQAKGEIKLGFFSWLLPSFHR